MRTLEGYGHPPFLWCPARIGGLGHGRAGAHVPGWGPCGRRSCRSTCARLSAALDAEPGLTCVQLVDAVKAPFQHVPSIPISLSTVGGMTRKRSVTSAVVLGLLRWMGASREVLAGLGNAPSREQAYRTWPDSDPSLRHQGDPYSARRRPARAWPDLETSRASCCRRNGSVVRLRTPYVATPGEVRVSLRSGVRC